MRGYEHLNFTNFLPRVLIAGIETPTWTALSSIGLAASLLDLGS